ncbi:MAG: EF-P lysine aminoacylase EpmA [Gammaproteobacteria bacterium]
MAFAWGPGLPLARLAARARTLATLRAFFASRGVLEVDTPLLSSHASTEPTLANLAVELPGSRAGRGYLRTSPESAMKRLLAAGSGDIYQLGPVFRGDELGRRHLREFTLLEWYRVGFDHLRLMDEIDALLRAVGYAAPVTRLAYGELFAEHFGVSPHGLNTAALAALVAAQGMALAADERDDRALLFDCLYATVLEPALATRGAVLLYDYPCELRAYARLSGGSPPVAERFELVVDGLELANGYHEITEAAEQAACFAAENALRARRGLPHVALDSRWLDALRAGMPRAAGVALGVERLLMVLEGATRIDQVAAFADELPG